MGRPRILLVGDYNRSDFLYVAKLLHEEVDFFFIEYLNRNFVENRECSKYGKILYWKDFHDAFELLKKVSPNKVVFYFIESYNHVALNITCKEEKIPCFHLEHGLRFSPSLLESIIGTEKNDSRPIANTIIKLRYLYDKYQNRRFFERTAKRVSFESRNFLKQYFQVRSRNSILSTFQKVKSNLRLPDTYISYSPKIFRFHKELENLSEDYPVKFIGIPSFDSYCKWKSIVPLRQDVLFIDQPLAEQKLMGWNSDKKRIFLKELTSCVLNSNKRLFIKPHPYNDQKIYDDFKNDRIAVIGENEWNEIVPNITIVLGFSSTLMLPFIGMDHICCFSLEMHPQKPVQPYSFYLLESCACNAVNDFEDLSKKIQESATWHKQQQKFKEKFVRDYLYLFDGRSSERLKKILSDAIFK